MPCNVADDPSHQATTSPNDAQLRRNSRAEEPESPENATEEVVEVACHLPSDDHTGCNIAKKSRVLGVLRLRCSGAGQTIVLHALPKRRHQIHDYRHPHTFAA